MPGCQGPTCLDVQTLLNEATAAVAIQGLWSGVVIKCSEGLSVLLVEDFAASLRHPGQGGAGSTRAIKPPVQLLEIFLLAFASMIWPALIAVVVVALASPEPVRLLSWFLAGALLTTVIIGSAIVLLLEEASIATDSHSAFGAAVDFVASAAAFLAAYIVWRRGRARGWSMHAHSAGGWSERTLSRGGLFAFVVGVVLNVIPGVLPFVAMKNIAALGYATGATLGLVFGFYLIMFLPAEIPLGCYLFAPERTTVAVDRLNAWLRRNALLLAVFVLAACGIYLAVRGIFAL